MDALSSRYYAPYLILILIERDTFRQIKDFTHFNRCIENSTQFELHDLSKNQQFEEEFLRFLKYIKILDAGDR